jgi:hypothetical protein
MPIEIHELEIQRSPDPASAPSQAPAPPAQAHDDIPLLFSQLLRARNLRTDRLRAD